MKYEDLWPDSIEDQYIPTANIAEIMKQQAAYLKNKSHGKVLLRFGHIKSITPFTIAETTMTSISAIAKMHAPREYIDNSNIDELKDANELYSQKRFGCELHNHSYRFRLFEMDLPPLYPIDVCVDEGIAFDIKEQYSEEAFEKYVLQVNNDNEFIELLKSIFSSKKVTYIRARLMEANHAPIE